MSYLALVDPADLQSAYIATVLPGNRLVDCSQLTEDFNFLAQLLFIPGLELHLYQDGRPVGTATIARPYHPDAFGLPGFVVTSIDTGAPFDPSHPLIASLRPLPLEHEATTPDWSELLERPKNLDPGERYTSYEPIGPLDLDGDGVDEILFRDYGMEAIGYSIFKYLEGEWRQVYRGGWYGY